MTATHSKYDELKPIINELGQMENEVITFKGFMKSKLLTRLDESMIKANSDNWNKLEQEVARYQDHSFFKDFAANLPEKISTSSNGKAASG